MGGEGSKEKSNDEVIILPTVEVVEDDSARYGEHEQTFNKFDLDRKGYLNEIEFNESIEHFIKAHPEKVNDLTELKKQIQIDEDNPIRKDEFRKLMYAFIVGQDPIEELIDVFKIFDKDNSKEITDIEILHVFDKLGLNLSRDDIKTLMSEADFDINNSIEFEEFIKIMIVK